MQGKKILLANILHSSNLINLFRRLPLKNKLVVLNYHRIRPDKADLSPPFDEGVFTIRASQFAMQIKWLKKNTRIFSERDIINGKHSKGKPSKPGILISFDDGYRDHYTIAYPTLKANEVPATFFIPTKLINTRQLGWWDLIAYLIKNSPRPYIIFEDRRFSFENGRSEVIEFFHQKMKLEKYEKTRHLIDDLAEACEVERPGAEIQDEQLLTWEQIKTMSEDIITIGSHTHSHRVLATLDPISQKEEMVLSKLILEQKLGQKINSIAYPVGEPEHFTKETQLIAMECGYRLGFTCNTGVNLREIDNLLAIKRVSGLLEDIRTVSAIVILPQVFMWDKAVSMHRDVLNKHPDYADFSFRLGLIYLGQGKIDEAIKNFQDALNKNPHYTEAQIKLAISKAYLGKLDEAAFHFGAVLEKHPAYADVHYLLGIVCTGQNKIQEAVACFKKALQLNPSYKNAKIKLGILYCLKGEYEAGLKELENASRLDPDDEELKMTVTEGLKILAKSTDSKEKLLELLKQIFFGGENLIDQTIQEFNKHIDISPNLSDMLSIITNYSDEDDALQVLVPLFEEYIDQYPKYSDLHNAFGTLYLKLNKLDKAEALFRECLNLNPNYFKARLNLFNTLKNQGRFKEALEEGKHLASKNLPYPDVYCGLGEVLFSLSMDDEALRNAQRALELNARYAKAYLLLAKIYERKGNHLDAIRALEKLFKLNPPKELNKKARKMINSYCCPR